MTGGMTSMSGGMGQGFGARTRVFVHRVAKWDGAGRRDAGDARSGRQERDAAELRLPVLPTAELTDALRLKRRDVDVIDRTNRDTTKPEQDQPSLEAFVETGDLCLEVFHPGGLVITVAGGAAVAGGCSLIWAPTARSSAARALDNSASICAIWSCTWSTSRKADCIVT